MKQLYPNQPKQFLSVYFAVLFVFLAVATTAQSQVWIDDHAKWTYNFWNFAVEGTYEFEYTSDTIYDELGGVWFYENFKTFGEWIDADECEFWGPPQCLPLNRPSWLGAPVTYDDDGHYTFYNLQEEPIQIDISLQTGDSALVYADSTQQFYMKGLGEEVTEILGIPDTIRKFRISHYDAEGNPINSALHYHEIITGKKLGLISFFRIDQFPETLLPLELVGDTEPETGLTQITYADIHDYQPGDVIQYRRRNVKHPSVEERL